ncbi:MAG: NAD(P)H-quinone oxidoreductase [Planctomycetia bacterium]|nr:NAD(P)H-quinone oxidoreductase [Planctomycetia bacterium]
MPAPEPRGDQVRVRVRACGLNRADLMQCRGYYPAPKGAPSVIPGLEYAGEIDALGPDAVGPLAVGARVFGIVSGGGLAEYVVTPERMAVPIPGNLDMEQAAAVPEVFLTAHDALEARAGLRPGESVLVHAVGSGVGTAAAQLAHAMGCTVFGTSRTAEKLRLAAGLGVDVGIDSQIEDFAEVVLRHTGGRGVDAMIDLVGAPALAGNLKALATCGRLVLVGLLGGGTGTVDLSVFLRKRLRVVGTTLRARPLEEKIAATRAFADRVVPWLERGLVRPVVDRAFAFEDVRPAQERLEANLGFGKVVLRV